MHPIESIVLGYLQKDWAAIAASAGVLFVAFVSCMPLDPPASITEYWRWVRESLQTAIPAARRNNHQDPPPNPPPDNSEKKD